MIQITPRIRILLTASIPWDIVAGQAARAEPIFAELVRQAAHGDVANLTAFSGAQENHLSKETRVVVFVLQHAIHLDGL